MSAMKSLLDKFNLRLENGEKHQKSVLKIFYRNQMVMILNDAPFPSGVSEFMFGDCLYRLRHLDRRYLHAHFVINNERGKTVKVLPLPIAFMFCTETIGKTKIELLDEICRSLFELTSHCKYYDAMRYAHEEEGVIFIKINANGKLWMDNPLPFSLDGYGKSLIYTSKLGYTEPPNTFRMEIENRQTLSPSQTPLGVEGYFWVIVIENCDRNKISALYICSCSWYRVSSAKLDAWLFLKKKVEPFVFPARISIRIMREIAGCWVGGKARQQRKLYNGTLLCEASLYSAIHNKIFDKDTRVDQKLPGYPELGSLRVSGII